MPKWPCAAIGQLIKDAGIEQLTEANAATVNRLDMVLLASSIWSENGADHCVYVFSSVECLCTWSKLNNQQHGKLCADGTFKQVFGKWCVIPLGVLSKHRAKTTSGGRLTMAWATCISPLLWVISSGELTKSYSLAIEAHCGEDATFG